MSLGSLEFVTMDEAVAAAAAAARVKVRRDRVDVLAEQRVKRAQDVAEMKAAHVLEPVAFRKCGHTFGDALDVAVEAESKAWK